MTAQDFPSFVETPARSSKPKSSTPIVESPVKVTEKRLQEHEIVSPQRPTKRPITYNFVEAAGSKTPYKVRRGAKKPVKPRKKKDINPLPFRGGSGFGDDGGCYNDFGDRIEFPKQCNGVKNGIEWSVKDEEVEMLKVKVVPVYWESLLDSPNSVVWVTERLYILRDWDRLGNLMVTLRYIRLISLGAAVQACLQDD